ncbi:mechanosensitive ion channel family protein [Nitrospira sp. NS4]|uniref:mechanosensitive ion channel family protein n=1 Tax=Nitrospira sp. NS4 TaxID=3414498 RepID=UPI003C2CA0F9
MITATAVIKRSLVAGLLLVLVGVSGWSVVVAADTPVAGPTMKKALETRAQIITPETIAGVPEDEFNRGTPRTSVLGFLQATRERDYERGAQYLDLSAGVGARGPELARQLRIVLGRELWVDVDTLSASPEGDLNDRLAGERDRIGRITGRTKSYDIVVQRVPREDGVSIWKFAGSTVAEIPQLYEEFGYGRLETLLPPWLFDYRIMGIEVVLWVEFILIAAAAFPVAMLLTAGIMRLLRRYKSDLAPEVERFFTGPIRMLLWVLLTRLLMQAIRTSVVVEAVSQGRTLLVVAVAWMGLRCLDLASQRIAGRLESSGLTGSSVLLRPITRLMKVLLIIGAILLWLENLGYQITTLLAGLSISGVAVALASQKTLENLFGAITLYTSHPVRVGDFCRFGNSVGTVEEIGLRATLIRTLDRSVISVPNAEFAHMHLDNLSRRDRFWYHPRLKLRMETTPDQIRYVLVQVRTMLYAHPKVLPEGLWVRFVAFGDMSLDVDVFAYMGVKEYSESLAVAEDLNLRIMDIIAQAGTELAVPSQIQYEVPGRPLDEERARKAEAHVREWREQRSLYLPNFPPDKITELKGSLDYPPAGSP